MALRSVPDWMALSMSACRRARRPRQIDWSLRATYLFKYSSRWSVATWLALRVRYRFLRVGR